MSEVMLSAGPEVLAAGRSQVYALLAEGFRPPTVAFHQRIRGGEFGQAIEAAAGALPYALAASAPTAETTLSLETLQAEYLGLFEIGGGDGPPCPLYEGEHGGGRLQVMEEALRFYRHFGLGLAPDRDRWDRPDHLATELEFLHVLGFREARALASGNGPAEVYRTAQRDFLSLHVLPLLEVVTAALAGRPRSFYGALVALGQAFCGADHQYLTRTA